MLLFYEQMHMLCLYIATRILRPEDKAIYVHSPNRVLVISDP